MSQEYKRRSQMQDVEEPPVIKNRKKRPMSGRKARPRRIAGKVERMPEGELVAPAVGGMEVMPLTPAEALVTPIPPAEMQPLEAKPVAGTGEHYVRLRVRVEGDQMEVVGAKLVEGPLVRPERLHAGLVYEAAAGNKLVDVDALLDVGVQRSFPPAPEGERMAHHIRELPSYEFAVRIPQQELSERALRKLRISVYRVKGRVPDERITGYALLEQFPAELRLVAELEGVRVDDLPDRVQAEIKKAVQR